MQAENRRNRARRDDRDEEALIAQLQRDLEIHDGGNRLLQGDRNQRQPVAQFDDVSEEESSEYYDEEEESEYDEESESSEEQE